MMSKNLIISTIGNNSCHKEWIGDNQNYDVVLIYYGDDESVYESYKNDGVIVIKQKGQKYPLIYSFMLSHYLFVEKYDYIWLPDDDVSISVDSINRLFEIAKKYDLYICQPSMITVDGKFSYDMVKPVDGNLLRFTSFVEIMAPLFNRDTLFEMYNDFANTESGWGLDLLWPYRLEYPENRIAIIDDVQMYHTKPLCSDYSRFRMDPWEEALLLMSNYGIKDKEDKFMLKEYLAIKKT